MQKLDRLGWADGISFKSYGLRVGVRFTDRSVMDAVVKRLPPGWKPLSSPIVDFLYSLIIGGPSADKRIQRFNLAYFDAARLARSKDLDDVLKIFESHLQITIADNAHRRVFVHAGVVTWRNSAILIPGRSFTGKTTLVEKLVKAGATYYSDEYAVLDERGLVHPFPRLLGIREPGKFETRGVHVETIGAQVGRRPARVGLVVLTHYKQGATWRPRPVTNGRGVLELLANTVSARSQTNLALSTLPRAVRSAQILRGVRGEAESVVDSILARVN